MAEPRPRVFVAYDYACPYSYVGLRRAQRLDERLDVEWVWLPWQMHPSVPDRGDPIEGVDEPGAVRVEGRPGELADELDEVFYWPPVTSNTEPALKGARLAQTRGDDVFEAYHEGVFEAIWQDGENVGDRRVLSEIAERAGLDAERFRSCLDGDHLDEGLRQGQEAVERLALTRRPTFVFGDQRIVGTDAFEASLAGPLEAFVDRWDREGPEETTTLAEDVGLRHPA